jgi:hypothetical protein
LNREALAFRRYSFPNSFSSPQLYLTQLGSLGLDLRTCCYEVAFIRHTRKSLKRNPVVPLPDGESREYEYPMVGKFRRICQHALLGVHGAATLWDGHPWQLYSLSLTGGRAVAEREQAAAHTSMRGSRLARGLSGVFKRCA